MKCIKYRERRSERDKRNHIVANIVTASVMVNIIAWTYLVTKVVAKVVALVAS